VNVWPVNVNRFHHVWPKVEKFIAAALDHSQGECSVDQAKVFLSQGKWTLVIAVGEDSEIKGAAVIEFFNRPNHRIALVIAAGGRLITDKDTYEKVCDICRQNGATLMECAARPSAARLWKSKLGFTEKYAILDILL